MAAMQIMLDELASKASVLDEEIGQLHEEMAELSAKAKVLNSKSELLSEKREQYQYAISGLRGIINLETPAPVLPSEDASVDPWGDAG
jgi:uncharacterized coiled-coil DUF342 family protein